MTEKRYRVMGEDAMVSVGRQLGEAFDQQALVFLQGDLGAGKTTLTRGVLQAFGHQGAVKSPTYTLVEPYQFDAKTVYHFDLYRLVDPEELEYMGIRDYLIPGNFCLIEWPNRGEELLPDPDLLVDIEIDSSGRTLVFRSFSERGLKIESRLAVSLSGMLLKSV